MVGSLSINLSLSTSSLAEPLTYTVQKGDTLWDICEKVYGDSDLWPKLWQMNPFITNPHLLNPGDVITLLEGVPIKKERPDAKEQAKPAEREEQAVSLATGVDVSGMVNVNAIGFLSRQQVSPVGQVFAADTERIILSEGDPLIVEMEPSHEVKPGEVFTVYHSSSLLKNPTNGQAAGYLIAFLGKVVIREQVEKKLYRAELAESYRAVRLGDTLMPSQQISSCVKLRPAGPDLKTNVVAIQDQHEIIGQYSVVYLPVGYHDGVMRGNVFEILRMWRETGIEMVKTSGYSSREAAPARPKLPDMVLGHILIVEARPDTATGVVVSTKENASNGVVIKGLHWKEALPTFLPMVTPCQAE